MIPLVETGSAGAAHDGAAGKKDKDGFSILLISTR
jgi:hypothetical protein